MIKILHLSDLHFCTDAQTCNMKNNLINEAKSFCHIPRGEKILIITGDFHNYYDEDYESAKSFLIELFSAMDIEPSEDVFMIPGNHDVGNDNALEKVNVDPSWRDASVAMIRKSGDTFADMNQNDKIKYLYHRLDAFTPYCRFAQSIGVYSEYDELLPAKVHIRRWRNKLNILHLNTALAADGKTKDNQMTDVDRAVSDSLWSRFCSDNMPSIVLGHNNFFDLNRQQQLVLMNMFKSRNISAYLCGDTHRINYRTETQVIPLEPQMIADRESIPNIVNIKGIGESADVYSDFGYILHEWDEKTGLVNITLRSWKSEMIGVYSDNGFGGGHYYMRHAVKNVCSNTLDNALRLLDNGLSEQFDNCFQAYKQDNVAFRTPQILLQLLSIPNGRLEFIFNGFTVSGRSTEPLGSYMIRICKQTDNKYRTSNRQLYDKKYELSFISLVDRAEAVRKKNGQEDAVSENLLCYSLLLDNSSSTVLKIKSKLSDEQFETLKKWVLEDYIPSCPAGADE